MNRAAISKIGTALLLCLISGAIAQAQAFHANGAFANAQPCSLSGTILTCLSVTVSRGGTTSSPSTLLFYDIFTLDTSTDVSLESLVGSGTIPNSAFQVQGDTDSLYIDTSTLNPSVFTNSTCTVDPSTGVPTCNPSLGGVVSIKWREYTPHFGVSFSGTSTFSSPGVKSKTTGKSDSNFALANVTVLGVTGTDRNANIGTDHSTFISVEHR